MDGVMVIDGSMQMDRYIRNRYEIATIPNVYSISSNIGDDDEEEIQIDPIQAKKFAELFCSFLMSRDANTIFEVWTKYAISLDETGIQTIKALIQMLLFDDMRFSLADSYCELFENRMALRIQRDCLNGDTNMILRVMQQNKFLFFDRRTKIGVCKYVEKKSFFLFTFSFFIKFSFFVTFSFFLEKDFRISSTTTSSILVHCGKQCFSACLQTYYE